MRSRSIESLIQKESRSKRSWKKWFLGVGLCLLLMLVVVWNVVGSEWFLRTVVLPRVGEAINGSITFQSADWALRRSLVLRGISVEAEGQKPCLQVEEFQVDYSLMELLSGETHLHQVKLVKPVVTVHVDELGQSNLDPFFDLPKKEPSSAPLLRLDNIKVFEGAFHLVRQFDDGGEEHITGVNLQVQANRIGNERAGGELNFSTGLQYVLLHTGVPPESLKGTLSLKTGLAFDRQWMPNMVESVARAKIIEAKGQFEVVRNLEVDCESVITQEEIKQLSLRLAQQANPVGTLSVSGPWNLKEGAAQLDIAMDGLDRRVLNLTGSRWGLDFRSTVITSTNQVILTHFGKQVEVSGAAYSKPFQLSYGRLLMPALEKLQTDYQVRIDLQAERLEVKRLQLIAHQNERKLMEGGIEKPMILAWGKEETEAPDSAFKMEFTDINAAEWQPWLGRFVREGRADLNVDVVSKKAGHQLDFTLISSGDSLKVPLQDNDIDVGNFDLNSSGRLKGFNSLNLDNFNVRLGLLADPVLQVSGPFKLDITKKLASGHLVAGGQVPVLLGWNPKVRANCKSGTFDYNGTLALGFGGSASQKFNGELMLRGFTGGNGGYSVTNLNSKVIFKADLDKGSTLNIDSLRAEADLNGIVLAKQIDTVGKMDLETGMADLSNLTLKEVDLKLVNQIVSLGALNEGKASASLKISHNPGEKTQLTGEASLSLGRINGWPELIHANLTQFDADLLWRDKGGVKTVVRGFQLKALNHNDRNRQDAFFAGSVEGYDSFTGRLDCTLKQSEVTHALLQPLLANQIGGVKLISGKITHSNPLKIGLDGREGIRIAGEVESEGIKFSDPTGRFPPDVFKAETDFDINYVRKGDDWNLNESNLTATFELGEGGIGKVSLNGKYQSSSAKGDFNASLKNVDYRAVNSLPEFWRPGVRLKTGKIERIDAAGKFSKGRVSGSLKANLKGLDITEKSGLWPAGSTDVEHEFIGSVVWGKELSIISHLNKGLIKQGAKTIAEYDFNGSQQHGDYNFHIGSLEVGPEFSVKALAKWIPEQKIRPGKIQLHQSELVLPRIGPGKFKGKIEFNGFMLEPDGARQTPTALDAALTVDATAKDRVFQINDFTALLPATEKAVNKAKVSGQLNLSQMRNPRADLKLESDELDITPLMELLLNKKPVHLKQSNPISNSSVTNRFALRQFKVGLDLKRLYWRDLVATNIVGRVGLNDRKYSFSPVQMHLMGKPTMIEGYVSAVPGGSTEYELNISCDKLPLNPIVSHFHPENIVEWGRLTANCYVKGGALRGELFKQTFRTRGIDPELPAILKIEGARWGFSEDNPFISAVASVLGVPQLLKSHFDTAKLDLNCKDTKAALRLEFGGPSIRLGTTGVGLLGENILDTTVKQEVKVELSPELADKFRPLGVLFPKDKFMKMPTFVSIEGPLRRPKPSINYLVVTRILGGGVLARPGSLLKNPSEILGGEDGSPLNPLNILRLLPGLD